MCIQKDQEQGQTFALCFSGWEHSNLRRNEISNCLLKFQFTLVREISLQSNGKIKMNSLFQLFNQQHINGVLFGIYVKINNESGTKILLYYQCTR